MVMLEVNGHIAPHINDTYALGTPALRWDTLFMASVIDFKTEPLQFNGAGDTSLVSINQADGVTLINSSVESTTKDNGALVLTNGGLGVEGNANIDGNLDVNGATTLDQTTIDVADGQFAVLSSAGGTNGVDINVPGGVSIDAGAASNFSTTGPTSAITIDAQLSTVLVDGNSGVKVTASNSGNVELTSANNDVDINANGFVTIDATTGDISLDAAAGAGNFTTAGTLTLRSTAGAVDIDGSLAGANNNVTIEGTKFEVSDVEIPGKLNVVSGQVTFQAALTSTTTTNGTLVVTGGAGISENLNVGGTLAVTGGSTFTGAVQINNTLGVTGVTSLTNTTESTVTGDGALVVSGGVGIAKNLNVGGTTTIAGVMKSNSLTVGGGFGDATAGQVGGTTITNTGAISTDGALTVGGTLGVTGSATFSSTVQATGNIGMTTATSYFYFGNPAAPALHDWRIGKSGNNLVFEAWDGTTWVTKTTMTY